MNEIKNENNVKVNKQNNNKIQNRCKLWLKNMKF